MKKMRKKMLVTVLTIVLVMLMSITAFAAENEWVIDEPQVLSQETADYVKNLNENVFANYRNKPQLGIIIINQLPSGYTIDEYKLDMFNQYGVGTKEENCGMLFVFSLADRKYGFEIGDGFEKGSLLRKDLEKDFITSDMKDQLREEEYDAVTFQIVQHLEQLMADEENGVYVEKERIFAEEEKQRKLREEEMSDIISKILIAVCSLVAAGSLIGLFLFKEAVKKAIGENQKYFLYFKIDEKLFTKYVSQNGIGRTEISTDFLKYVYQYYMEDVKKSLMSRNESSERKKEYLNFLEKENTYKNFISFNMKDIDTIIYEVDKRIAEEERIEQKNSRMIQKFIEKNKERIENKELSLEELNQQMKKHCEKGKVLSPKKLEHIFTEELKALNFKYEYDKFIEENKDQIKSSYFRREDFYRTLRNSEEYKRYCYSRCYNRSWMLPLLIHHMEDNKREAQRRETMYAYSRNSSSGSSSFGSGFSGGFSSGGGFSGGW